MEKNYRLTRIIKRVFTKIQLFDILVVSLAIILGVTFFVLSIRKGTYLTITVKVGDENISWPSPGTPPWYLSQLTKGMVEKDLLGKTQVEIINIFYYPIEPNKKVAFLTLKIKAIYSKTTSSYVFNSKPVVVGNTIRVKPGNILIEGIITHIEGIKEKRVEKKLKVETRVVNDSPAYPNTSGIYPFLVEAVHVGDEIKDPNGKTIIKILEKKVENAQRIVVTDSGKTFLVSDPLKKDLYLTLEVNATKFAEDYFIFDTTGLVVGSVIPLQFKNVILWPTITKIED